MDGTRKYHLEWGNLITKEHTGYALTDKWILAQKFGIPNIQFTDHLKLKKKKDQSVDTSVFLRSEMKIPKWVDTETMFGAETEGKAMQWLSHLVIHPIYSYQTQTLLWMPTSVRWQMHDIAVSWESLPVPDKYRSDCTHTALYWTEHRVSNRGDKGPKELKEFAAP
jgi:hypothetical protein